jgi:hypothetical protein
VLDMLESLVGYKEIPFSTVLMDSWYARNKIMLYIDDLGKYYYCPLKRNRLVDDTTGNEDYQKIENLSWQETELKDGKIIKIKRFPGSKKVKLFRVAVSTDRTDYIATNDLSQNSTDVVQQVYKIRWKIEEFHARIKTINWC